MDAIQILADVGIQLKQWRRGQHYIRCPRCTTRKTDQHLSVYVTDEGHALWKCWRCGDFSGSTAAIARKLEWESKRKGRGTATNHGPGRTEQSQQPTTQGDSRERVDLEVKPVPPVDGPMPEHVAFEAKHAEFWASLEAVTADCPVGRYLTGRGCHLPAAADLRWHPDFGYLRPNSNWRGPCMVALITSAMTAAPMSFHFTWINPATYEKAPLERPRLLAKGMSKMGGVIRLCDDAELGEWLMVGEGIETMLSAQVLTGMPQAWAAIDAGNLAQMPIPDWLRSIVVVADHDKLNPRTGKRAGLQAASDLIERCIKTQTVHDVEVIYPPQEGWDANDMLQARRRAEGVA